MNSKKDLTIYPTETVKNLYPNHSEEIQKALKRFRGGDFGTGAGRPPNDLIRDFGSYELSFGTLWIISYNLFTNRDFITLLLPEEYERREQP